MARISKVSASFPRYIFRYWRGLDGSFILTTPPSPAALISVQSFGKCRAPVRWRQGAEIRQRPSSPASANRLATSLVVFRIGEGRRSAPFARRRGQPLGLRVEPDQKRSALLQGGILVAPVRRAAGRRCPEPKSCTQARWLRAGLWWCFRSHLQALHQHQDGCLVRGRHKAQPRLESN